MHHHILAHAGPHIIRTLLHVLLGAAVVTGIGWTVHAAKEEQVLKNIGTTFNQVNAKAQKAAENLFSH